MLTSRKCNLYPSVLLHCNALSLYRPIFILYNVAQINDDDDDDDDEVKLLVPDTDHQTQS